MSSDPVPGSIEKPGSEQRNWAMTAHLCGLLWLFGGGSLLFPPFGVLTLFTVIGPLIIWRGKGTDMPFVAAQAKESLNFQITMLLLGLACIPFLLIGIGFLFLWVLGLANLIYVVIATIQVSDGKSYRYPFSFRLVH
jgi:uncharacterized protein